MRIKLITTSALKNPIRRLLSMISAGLRWCRISRITNENISMVNDAIVNCRADTDGQTDMNKMSKTIAGSTNRANNDQCHRSPKKQRIPIKMTTAPAIINEFATTIDTISGINPRKQRPRTPAKNIIQATNHQRGPSRLGCRRAVIAKAMEKTPLTMRQAIKIVNKSNFIGQNYFLHNSKEITAKVTRKKYPPFFLYKI